METYYSIQKKTGYRGQWETMYMDWSYKEVMDFVRGLKESAPGLTEVDESSCLVMYNTPMKRPVYFRTIPQYDNIVA